MLVVAIDPGMRVGCALYSSEIGYLTCTYDQSTLADLYDTIRSADQIVLENFDTGGRVDHNMLGTVEIIGGVKAVCMLADIQLALQWPQERMSFRADAINILVAQGRHVVDTKQKDNHEIDALAHLLTWQHYQMHPQDQPRRKRALAHNTPALLVELQHV